MRYHVIVDTLNVRSAPSTSAPILRQLTREQVIDAIAYGGQDAWAEIAPGEWCALARYGTQYLAPGEPPVRPTHPVGFDAPVGTDAERAIGVIWPGRWVDANPYLTPYSMGYHTGADLNLNAPYWNADKDANVYACSAGVVTWAGTLPGTWGGVVVIKHNPLSDGTPVYTRYAHLRPNSITVSIGDNVPRGCAIGQIGPMPGAAGSEHLHFDVSVTDILATNPAHWPGGGAAGQAGVLAHYVDPKKFLQNYHDGVGFPPEADCPGGGV